MPIWPLPMTAPAPNAKEMLKNRITEIRNARGLSIEELAERADMSPSYISRMARGERNITLKNLEKLAAALECQPEDLMGGEVPPADIAAIWAAIPPERRDLALTVLQSFTNTPSSTQPDADTVHKGTHKKRPTRNL